jgi:tetratricopeptide (TPR) repeat protein
LISLSFFLLHPAALCAQEASTPKIRKLLDEGAALLKSHDPQARKRGAYLLLQTYKQAPIRFDTLLGATRACNQLAGDTKDKNEMKRWGKEGWFYAKQIIKQWPQKAEGYFWSSINIGQYARGGGVWVAMTQGLAGKIEQMALESIKRDRKLYKGGAQRILGRFYFSLPWPMKKIDKSIAYLREALQLSPHDPTGIRFLAEALWDKGLRDEARKLFRLCSQKRTPQMEPHASPNICQRWLAQHR